MAISLALFLGSTVADAQPATETERDARVHFDRGLTLFGQQNFDGALAEFLHSYALNARPSVLYNLGVTYQALHRYPEAARALDDYLRASPGIAADRRAQVETALRELRAFIAYARVVVPANTTVTLDGEVVRLPPDATLAIGPGRHTVEATAPDHDPARETFMVASGETRVVTLAPVARNTRPITLLAPANAAATRAALAVTTPDVRPPPSGLPPTFFYAGLATTGVMLLGGVTFGLLTASTRDEVSQHYLDELNTSAVQDLLHRGESFRLATNVFFGAAALTGIATIVLIPLTRFRDRRATRVEVGALPRADGGGAQLRVTF